MLAEDIATCIRTSSGKDEYDMFINNTKTDDQNTAGKNTGSYVVTSTTTLNELISILRSRPEMKQTLKAEQDAENAMKMQNFVRERLLMDGMAEDEDDADDLIRDYRCPGAVQLRMTMECLGRISVGSGSLEVFANGYAVYDNGDRKTVLWVPDCRHVTYYFAELKESERAYLPQKAELGEEVLGELPWFNALVVVGENLIEKHMDRPKNNSNASDACNTEADAMPARYWAGTTRFEDPETAYLRKEAREERRAVLTEKQREAYDLYYEEGYTLREVAKILNLSHQAVDESLKEAIKRIKKVQF